MDVCLLLTTIRFLKYRQSLLHVTGHIMTTFLTLIHGYIFQTSLFEICAL